MPTRPSSTSAASSTSRGGGQSQKRLSNPFLFFWQEASLGCHDQHIIRMIWLNRYKGRFLKVEIVPFLHFRPFAQKMVRNFVSIFE